MSYQCKNCEREKDQNNNYVNASYAANAHGTRGNSRGSATRTSRSTSDLQQKRLMASGNDHHNTTSGAGVGSQGGAQGGASSGPGAATQVTAKVMWGSVGAIKELREKEQAERNQVTRAGRRQ